MRIQLRLDRALLALLLLAAPLQAQDWSNYGGNAQRNGRTALAGPESANLLWSNAADFSLISWHPFVLGERVFTVREAGFPQSGGAANDAIVAYDLYDGTELWRTTLPFGGDTTSEWIAWIGGARDGKLYASRSSNLQPQPLLALDAASGATLWTSQVASEAWAHDGIVFAPNGDVILGDRLSLTRIDHTDGSTVWSTTRSCPVSGNCGAAATDTALFIDEPAVGGNKLTKLDLATGAILYSSATMPGFTDQNTPFISADGATVFFSRTQNNNTVDFLYAFDDDGTQFTQKWMREVRWTTSHEHGLAQDGSIYTFTPLNEFVRLDPATGQITANAGVLALAGTSNLSPKTAVDVHGRVYVSNGWASSPASDGRLWVFDGDLTTNLFTLNLNRQNSGGPVIAGDGILIVCDRDGVRAYRESAPGHAYCYGDGSSASCPCANGGASGEGCANSTGPGALLGGSGTTSAAADDLVLSASQLPSNFFGVVFAGLSAIEVPFGDGLRCAGGGVLRYPPQNSGAGGNISQPNIAGLGNFSAGDTRHFQYWYRDPAGPCGSGFNTSNALEIDFAP